MPFPANARRVSAAAAMLGGLVWLGAITVYGVQPEGCLARGGRAG